MSRPHDLSPAPSAPSDRIDVLIVGSGPIGATFAREISEQLPGCTILMVDRGPVLSEPAGTNLNNFLPGGVYAADAAAPGDDLIPRVPPESLARSGTQLLRQGRAGGMPAAAVSTNVGGMGAHWSCATPPPGDDERTDLIPGAEFDRLLARAGQLLQSTTRAFAGSARGAVMTDALSAAFDGLLERPVQVMPHACLPTADQRLAWTGTDTVLGGLGQPHDGFQLRADTLCTAITLEGDRVVGGTLVDVGSGVSTTVRARVVVVACDSLRTPQLLWASGIRPAALGRHLNEHPMVGATIVLGDHIMAEASRRVPGVERDDFAADPLAALWVPYAGSTHRFSGQIENSPGSPAGFHVDGLEAVAPSRVVSLTWFCPKTPRPEDRVDFTGERGPDGMPVAVIDYARSARDDAAIEKAISLASRAGSALGTFVDGQHPALLADGQSLHYMGTVRMGAADDGTSVCDSFSRVWGYRGLYVGGNGVIPVATACNPTLTSVAFAIRSARAVAEELAP